MYQKPKILFFCMIFVANSVFSQNSPKIIGYPLIKNINSLQHPVLFSSSFYNSIPVLPGNFIVSQLGFFCKKEWKFESVTKLPFRFRLGSVQYVDWMEGKKNCSLLH